MTQAEKLEALIKRAIDNGGDLKLTPLSIHDYVKLCLKSPWQEQLLFGSHDFVKVLFGNGPNCAYCGEPPRNMHQSQCVEGSNIWPYLWQYHLQQAVISNDPIDYMYKAVFDDES
jgi:hypothetical protein